MPAYMLARVEVTDPEQYKKYTAVSPGVIEQFGGRFVVRGGESVTVEGPEETRRLVVVEFPSVERARAFYDSPEYQAAKALRVDAGHAQFVIVDGVS